MMGKKRVKKARKSTSKRGPYRVKSQQDKGGVRKGLKQRKLRSAKGLKLEKKPPCKAGGTSKTGQNQPPKEYQFKPGQSGNPAGLQKGQTHLRWYICKYLAMTEGQRKLEKKRKDLTGSQSAAIKAVEQIVKQGLAGVKWLAIRELMHYDEGKPTEHVKIDDGPATLSEEDCERIRGAFLAKFGKRGT